MASPQPPEKPRIHPGTYLLMGAFLLGGLLVAFNYVRYHNENARAQYESLHGDGATTRPPFLNKMEEDLEVMNWGTETVHLIQLEGKVWLGSYAYTDCHEECEALIAELKESMAHFADEPRLMQVLFSVDSAADTPEKIAAFRDKMEIPQERWWYLTETEAAEEGLEAWVRQWVLLKPSKQVEAKEDQESWIDHDLRVFLIDAKANLRGYYSLLNPEYGDREQERMHKDIQYLLDQETPPLAEPKNDS